jgi:hypothetical protein
MRPSLSAARSTHRLLREEVPVERRWDAPLRELLLEKGEVAVVCAERRRGSIGMRQQPSSRLMRVAPGTNSPTPANSVQLLASSRGTSVRIWRLVSASSALRATGSSGTSDVCSASKIRWSREGEAPRVKAVRRWCCVRGRRGGEGGGDESARAHRQRREGDCSGVRASGAQRTARWLWKMPLRSKMSNRRWFSSRSRWQAAWLAGVAPGTWWMRGESRGGAKAGDEVVIARLRLAVGSMGGPSRILS